MLSVYFFTFVNALLSVVVMRHLLSLGKEAISAMYGGCNRDESGVEATVFLGRWREVEQQMDKGPLPVVIENNW
ncbi:hypothetical protein AAZX31_12G092100 [Glycine max]